MQKSIKLYSFGFKYHGQPPANIYIDVSFLKNPARELQWGLFSEITNEMIEWVSKQKGFEIVAYKSAQLLSEFANYDDDIRCAFGCSSGRHRSPIMAEKVGWLLKISKVNVIVKHLELECTEIFPYTWR